MTDDTMADNRTWQQAEDHERLWRDRLVAGIAAAMKLMRIEVGVAKYEGCAATLTFIAEDRGVAVTIAVHSSPPLCRECREVE